MKDEINKNPGSEMSKQVKDLMLKLTKGHNLICFFDGQRYQFNQAREDEFQIMEAELLKESGHELGEILLLTNSGFLRFNGYNLGHQFLIHSKDNEG